jgi:uncharacterized caspase-like protein
MGAAMTMLFRKSRVVQISVLMLAVLLSSNSSCRARNGTHDPHPKGAANRFDHLARSIGEFEFGNGQYTRHCTAAVISPEYILTLDRCVQTLDSYESWRASIRLKSPGGDSKLYPVKLPPIERNEKLGFAVLEVEGDPAAQFNVARLMVRDPRPNERVLLFQWGTSESIELVSNCMVLSVAERTLSHSCEASVGSAGALLFSEEDETVLGLVDRLEGKGGWLNSAQSMSSIVRASPNVGREAYVKVLPPPVVAGQGEEIPIALQDGVPKDMPVQSVILLNGKKQRITRINSAQNTVTLLGDGGALKQGLNALETANRKLIFWNEQRVLSAFENPYRDEKSYAVIVAIDDYDRTSDPQRRPATGYRRLANMRERAEELRATLIKVGFPPNNIFTYYDEEATAKNIDEKLGDFWEGGRLAEADRLFFYFGGHGDGVKDSGYLVTYDIDRERPTRTGFLMSDFVTRHFPNIKARHVLVALDACASGLTIPGKDTLSGGLNDEQIKHFATLSAIRTDTGEHARNLLVAGTDEQRALWETGGIFTQALIEGLQGEADLIRDGVIQFDELSLFVERRVTARAAEVGVRQDPRSFLADRYGRGKMLFILPDRR